MWAREIGALCGVSVPLQAAEHMYLITKPMGNPIRPGLAARPRQPDILPPRQGGGGRAADGRLRVGGQALGHGRDTGGLPLRHPRPRLGPLQGLLGARHSPRPCHGGGRDRPVRSERGELHARQQVPDGRVPRAAQLLGRSGAELHRNRRSRRRGQGGGRVDRRGPPDHGPRRGGHKTLPSLQ